MTTLVVCSIIAGFFLFIIWWVSLPESAHRDTTPPWPIPRPPEFDTKYDIYGMPWDAPPPPPDLECSECKGSGYVIDHDCSFCRGTGASRAVIRKVLLAYK